ncbi:MAG: hypothetical protein LBE48_00535 [Methanomassiliicoccaceae archaeon]|jgi:hypothetical protein|nr:hypothetical protein [Methanomassiliicoccaceae archaeon]
MGIHECASSLDEMNRSFICDIDNILIEKKYNLRIAGKEYLKLTYTNAKTKRGLVSFTISGDVLDVHIYADHVSKYIDDILPLPDVMLKSMKKGRKCDNLVNPGSCYPECIIGYDFFIDGARYQKCRYMNFKFPVNDDTRAHIRNIILKEMSFR